MAPRANYQPRAHLPLAKDEMMIDVPSEEESTMHICIIVVATALGRGESIMCRTMS